MASSVRPLSVSRRLGFLGGIARQPGVLRSERPDARVLLRAVEVGQEAGVEEVEEESQDEDSLLQEILSGYNSVRRSDSIGAPLPD